MKYIVYKTKNKKNGKFYIGVHKTENPETFDGYLGNGIFINQPSSYMNPTRAFQYAVKKYGTSAFERDVLAIFDTSEEAYKLESELVTLDFIQRKDVYNVKVGGASTYVPIFQFTLSGKFIKKWETILEASRFFAVSDTAIRNKCEYKKSINGYYLSTDSEINVSEYSETEIGIKCYKYNKDFKFIDSYESINECAEANNLNTDDFTYNVKKGNLMKGYYYSFTLTEEYIKPKINFKNTTIHIYDLEGNYIITTKNENERKEFFNTTHIYKINKAVLLNKNYNSYQFSLDFVESMPKYIQYSKPKKIGQYTMAGELIKIFDTQRQAESEFGSGVRKVIKGTQKHCHNYIFRIIS